MHAEQPKSKRLEYHDYTLTLVLKKIFGDAFFSAWLKAIDEKRRAILSNIKGQNREAQKILDDFTRIGLLLMIMERLLYFMMTRMAKSAAGV